MTIYQVQVKFRHPSTPRDGIWLTVSKLSSKVDARHYVEMWKRSANEAKNIAGIRVMSEGKEVNL